jgi:fibronectin-binding autotransporter adhesin
MATQVQFRRGTTTENNAFTGAAAEFTVDTTLTTVRVHDGTTAGGVALLNVNAAQTVTNKSFGSGNTWQGNNINLAYGGTGASITAVQGAVVWTDSGSMATTLAGTAGQILTSGGTSAPIWVTPSALTVGTASTATSAENITGGSAGYLVYQYDTDDTRFIQPGLTGYVLQSTGASTAPEWVTSDLTIGDVAVTLGTTVTDFTGLTSLDGTTGLTSLFTTPTGSVSFLTSASAVTIGASTSTVTIADDLAVGGNLTVTGTTTFNGGTITLGDAATDNVVLGADVNSNIVPNTDGTYDLGSSTQEWNDLFIDGTAHIDTLDVDENATVTGTLGVTGATTLTGQLTANGGITADGGVFTVADTTGNVHTSGTLDVDGAANFDSTVQVDGDVNIDGGDLTTTASTFNLVNTNATTVNIAGAATSVNIGAATGTVTLNNNQVVFSTTDSIQIPVGTTAQRDSSPSAGQIRYNTTLSSFEGYGPGDAWGSLGGVKDVDGDTYLLTEASAGSDEDTFEFYNAGTNTMSLDGTALTFKNDTYLQFDTDATAAPASHSEGALFYSNEYKTLTMHNDISGSSLQIGHEEWVRVKNVSGSTISNGTAVYITGASGETPTVAPADATTQEKAEVLGIVTNDIANNAEGVVTTRGLVSGFDTSALTAGQRVHVGVDGSLQTAAPTTPYFATDVGTCVVSDATDGYIYVTIQEHTFEQFRVTGNTKIDGNLTVAGDFTVQGTQTITSQANLALDNAFIYMNSGDTIGEANTTFSGSGLDDAYFTGHFEGTSTTNFYVRIDGVGTGTGGVDTFEWSLDNWSTTEATGVDITGSDQTLGSGISILFNATTGHTDNDQWSGTAAPLNVDSGWASNRNTGSSGVGYTHMGVVWDVNTSQMIMFDTYDPEIEGNIDTGHASFNFADLQISGLTATTGTFSGNTTIGGTLGVTSTLDAATGSTIGNLTLANGSITDSSGAISFGNENLSTTGTLSAGATTVTGLTIGSDSIAEYIADTVGSMVSSNTESGISVSYQDADNTLDFDVADFSITLTGDVTGTGTVTNLGNVSFATTIAANSVALGTDTTGAYVQDITGGTYISTSETAAGAESNVVTINHDDTTRSNTTDTGTLSHSGTFTAITGVTTNTQGHVTGTETTTYTLPAGAIPNDATITLSGGTGVSGGGNFTTDQSSNETITFSIGQDVATSASVTFASITETSDERLKTNITQLSNAVDTVKSLNGKSFIKDNKAKIGLIAQEVENILPQVVDTLDDEMQTKTVNYGNIVAVLIEAIKEQQVQIDELKAKLGE